MIFRPTGQPWIIGFSLATERAAANAVRLAEDTDALNASTLEQYIAHRRQHGVKPARPRRDAVVLRILQTLATDPVLTVESVARRFKVSTAAAHRALVSLADAGVLGRTKDQKGKLICWTADRHLALVTLTERSNRAGGVDTGARRPQNGPAVPDATITGRSR